MLRKRTIALIVLLLTITVACIGVRLSGEKEANFIKEPIDEKSEIITEPAPPTKTIIADPTPRPADPVSPTPKPVVPIKNTDTCYVGGCSGQICSDSNDIVSTCEWRDSYACYRNATCERQVSGECGWTETAELKSCLINTDSEQNIQVM